MAIRLDESDKYMHELGPESNFNESMHPCHDKHRRRLLPHRLHVYDRHRIKPPRNSPLSPAPLAQIYAHIWHTFGPQMS